MTHDEVLALIADSMFGQLSPTKLTELEGHVDTCEDCCAEYVAAGAIHRLAASNADRPLPQLRANVLRAAFERRKANADRQVAALLAWNVEIRQFRELVEEVAYGVDADAAWTAMCIADYDLTVGNVVCHLIATESLWAQQLGAGAQLIPEQERDLEPRTRQVITRHDSLSRAQTLDEFDRVVHAVAEKLNGLQTLELQADSDMIDGLDVESYIAYRAIETWTHADDVRIALGRSAVTPAADHLRTMTNVLTHWIPAVVAHVEPDAPGRRYQLHLTGAGGSDHDITTGVISNDDAAKGQVSEPDVFITCDVVDFCKLATARRDPDRFDYLATGDIDLARSLIMAMPQLAVM